MTNNDDDNNKNENEQKKPAKQDELGTNPQIDTASGDDIHEEDEFAAFEREAKEAAAMAAARMGKDVVDEKIVVEETAQIAEPRDPIAQDENSDLAEEEEDEFAAFEREAKEAAAAAAARMGGGAAVTSTKLESEPNLVSADVDLEEEEDEFAAFEREAREAAASAAARMGGGASGDEAVISTQNQKATSDIENEDQNRTAHLGENTGEALKSAQEDNDALTLVTLAEIAAARKLASDKLAKIIDANSTSQGPKSQTIAVIGGGIAGITAALEAAETGFDVILLEKSPNLGGRVTRLNRYFPKLCHPTCGLEINYQRIKKNSRIKLMTMSEVTNVAGKRGDYKLQIKSTPRFVNAKCTACGDCAKIATTNVPNEYNYGLDTVKSAHLPHEHAFPMRYVIAPVVVGTPEGEAIKKACKYDAVDLDEKETIIELNAGAIIWATGWRPYDAAKIEVYSYSRSADIINNVEMERLANYDGPTQGKIVRPSDGAPAKKVAMIQCAGSRDKNHLSYCSMICCLGSLKHAAYVREQYEEAQIDIYYIDIRAHDKMSSFYERVRNDPNINFIKSKPGHILVGDNGKPLVCGEHTTSRELYRSSYDLVVLATGMEPDRDRALSEADDLEEDEHGFVIPALGGDGGQFSAGVASGPVDVALSAQSATAAALKAIQAVKAD